MRINASVFCPLLVYMLKCECKLYHNVWANMLRHQTWINVKCLKCLFMDQHQGPTQFCALPVLQNNCSIYCNQARNMDTQSSTCAQAYAICNHLHSNEFSKSQKIPFRCVSNAAKRDSNHKMSLRDIHFSEALWWSHWLWTIIKAPIFFYW